MNEQEIKSAIIQLLKKITPDADPEALNEDENFRSILGMDSFDFLQFMVAINEHLQVEIPEQDYSKIVSLKNLTDYIVKKKA